MYYIEAITDKHFKDTKNIFMEYQKNININLSFQNFKKELDDIPGKYSSPYGSIILVYDNHICIGCVALRPISNEICEMKRLFVKKGYRGKHIGKELCKRIIKKAIEIGYSKMRLDTLSTMKSAVNIYKMIGFKEIESYYNNPIATAKYFEYELIKGVPNFV